MESEWWAGLASVMTAVFIGLGALLKAWADRSRVKRKDSLDEWRELVEMGRKEHEAAIGLLLGDREACRQEVEDLRTFAGKARNALKELGKDIGDVPPSIRRPYTRADFQVNQALQSGIMISEASKAKAHEDPDHRG
jgi:hypothetical protein